MVVGSNLVRGSVDSLYPSVYIYITLMYTAMNFDDLFFPECIISIMFQTYI